MAQYKLGRKGRLYFNDDPFASTGTVDISGAADRAAALALWATWFGDGGLATAGNVTDVTVNVASENADGTTRETAEWGFASEIAVINGASATFEMRWKGQARLSSAFASPFTFTEAVLKSWIDVEPIALVFLDQARPTDPGTVVVSGLAGMFNVSVDFQQPLRDIQRASVTVTHADSAIWYEESITIP